MQNPITIDRFNGVKFFVAIAAMVLAVYVGYQGWISVPPLAAIGGLFGLVIFLVVVALIIIAANVDNVVFRMLALLGAFILGVFMSDVWSGLGGYFSSMSLNELGGFVLMLVVGLGLAGYLAKRD